MNKRQKKKRLEREKKEIIKGMDYIEGVFTRASEQMRIGYQKMPQGEEKIYHDFFITGFEYATKMLGEAIHQIRSIK
ncbi:hypothetical protein [Streptococcus agalactiae]|uniref:hypothetical protein n=1 Tax=Streptococcus agalactiae TaxID=1311 RepID=UPI000308BA37|nr:hypothetical protein [Streptococcus agalactiae]